jgi:hypothetical protein
MRLDAIRCRRLPRLCQKRLPATRSPSRTAPALPTPTPLRAASRCPSNSSTAIHSRTSRRFISSTSATGLRAVSGISSRSPRLTMPCAARKPVPPSAEDILHLLRRSTAQLSRELVHFQRFFRIREVKARLRPGEFQYEGRPELETRQGMRRCGRAYRVRITARSPRRFVAGPRSRRARR